MVSFGKSSGRVKKDTCAITVSIVKTCQAQRARIWFILKITDQAMIWGYVRGSVFDLCLAYLYKLGLYGEAASAFQIWIPLFPDQLCSTAFLCLFLFSVHFLSVSDYQFLLLSFTALLLSSYLSSQIISCTFPFSFLASALYSLCLLSTIASPSSPNSCLHFLLISLKDK